MKYISFAIPSYNSESYMSHAIETILTGGEEVEIIVVNDGSKDRTSEIGHEYAEKYPSIVKVVDKPNGGHGDAVICGLSHATGKYFKVHCGRSVPSGRRSDRYPSDPSAAGRPVTGVPSPVSIYQAPEQRDVFLSVLPSHCTDKAGAPDGKCLRRYRAVSCRIGASLP